MSNPNHSTTASVCLCLVLTWGIAACTPDAGTPRSRAVAMRVQALVVKTQNVRSPIRLYGQIVARDPALVNAPADGMRIERVLVEAGDVVAAGQALLMLDTRLMEGERLQALQALSRAQTELKSSEMQLAQARSAAALASDEYQRYQSVAGSGGVSALDIGVRKDSATQRQADLAAATRSAQAAKELLSAATLAANVAQSRAAEQILRAPFSGVISERRAEAGALSSAASGALFKIARADDREFEALVDPTILLTLTSSSQASVEINGVAFSGRVRSIERAQASDSRRARIRIALEAALDSKAPARASTITLGVAAQAEVQAPPEPQLNVPAQALQFDPQPWVFVVDDKQQVRKRAVQLHPQNSQVIAGLREGEIVVRNAAALLSPGQRVEAVLPPTTAVPATQSSAAGSR